MKCKTPPPHAASDLIPTTRAPSPCPWSPALRAHTAPGTLTRISTRTHRGKRREQPYERKCLTPMVSSGTSTTASPLPAPPKPTGSVGRNPYCCLAPPPTPPPFYHANRGGSSDTHPKAPDLPKHTGKIPDEEREGFFFGSPSRGCRRRRPRRRGWGRDACSLSLSLSLSPPRSACGPEVSGGGGSGAAGGCGFSSRCGGLDSGRFQFKQFLRPFSAGRRVALAVARRCCFFT